jgi:hypothetical protein
MKRLDRLRALRQRPATYCYRIWFVRFPGGPDLATQPRVYLPTLVYWPNSRCIGGGPQSRCTCRIEVRHGTPGAVEDDADIGEKLP